MVAPPVEPPLTIWVERARRRRAADTSTTIQSAAGQFCIGGYNESFQNWQSEFLWIAVLVVLGIYLRQRGKALERENRELRQANEILREASAYFAQAELDRPLKR